MRVQNEHGSLNFTSKFFVIFLNVFGVPIGCQITKFFKYYFIYAFFSVTISQILMLREGKTIVDTSFSLIYILSGIYFNATTSIIYFKRSFLLSMYNIARAEFTEEHSFRYNMISVNWKFKRFFFQYGILFFCIYGLSLLSPFLFFPLSGKQLGDVSTLIVPSKLPWNFNTYTKYCLTVLLQLSWIGFLSVPVLLNFVFVIYFIIEVRTQFDILSLMIRNLDKWTVGSLKNENKRFCDSFKNCIQRHQKILRFVNYFIEYFKLLIYGIHASVAEEI